MSRKTLTTLIIVFFFIIFGGLLGAYLYISGHGSGASQQEAGDNSGGYLSNFFSFFRKNPNGSGTGSNEDFLNASTTAIQTQEGSFTTIPRLRQISATPTAGADYMQKIVASTTIDSKGNVKKITLTFNFIRYMERATGHIFETKPDSLLVNEILNVTKPKIYQELFTNNGASLIFRYLSDDEDTIETYFGSLTLPKTATSTATTTTSTSSLASKLVGQPLYQLLTSALPENIPEIAVSPARDQIFYLKKGGQGTIGIVAATNNTKQKQILNSPLNEWQISWPKSNTIALTTKPSKNVLGYLFFLNTGNGSLSKVFGRVAGLTTLVSPDLSSVLFSESNDINFSLNVYTPKNAQTSPLSLKTLPEKCIWSQKSAGIAYCAVPIVVPPGDYPDIWYQGKSTFADNIWKVNVKTRATELLAKPFELTGNYMDAIDLSMDSNENYLMFINKKDLTLWNLLLVPPSPVVPVVSTSTASTTGATTTPR